MAHISLEQIRRLRALLLAVCQEPDTEGEPPSPDESELVDGLVLHGMELLAAAEGRLVDVPDREIPIENSIKLFFHCGKCAAKKPPRLSLREWSKIEAGWTQIGFQVWCRRCEVNICHVDFQGIKHPALTVRPREKSEADG